MSSDLIRTIRKQQGLSQQRFADAVGVTRICVSYWETGKRHPSAFQLIRIAKLFGLDLEDFLRPPSLRLLKPAYRKTLRLRQKELGRIEPQILKWLESYLEVERTVLSPAEIPGLPSVGSLPEKIATPEQAEAAAAAVRRSWGLGGEPIANLTELLEDRGIRVGLVAAPPSFNGCCHLAEWEGGELCAIVVNSRMSGDRQRFTLAHELAHALLVFDETLAPSAQERLAHRFAGALLLPQDAMVSYLGGQRSALSLFELKSIKRKHGISMQAAVYRAHELGIVPESFKKRFFVRFSRKGWRAAEPGRPIRIERPSRYARLVVRALAEGAISRREAGRLLRNRLPLRNRFDPAG